MTPVKQQKSNRRRARRGLSEFNGDRLHQTANKNGPVSPPGASYYPRKILRSKYNNARPKINTIYFFTYSRPTKYYSYRSSILIYFRIQLASSFRRSGEEENRSRTLEEINGRFPVLNRFRRLHKLKGTRLFGDRIKLRNRSPA